MIITVKANSHDGNLDDDGDDGDDVLPLYFTWIVIYDKACLCLHNGIRALIHACVCVCGVGGGGEGCVLRLCLGQCVCL